MSRARVWIATLVLAGSCLAIFGPALVRGEIYTFRDHSDYFVPLRMYTAQHLRAERLPLWNPYNGSGEPWLANPQTGIFYPPAWMFVVMPFTRAYVAYIFVHALLLAAGTFLLLSRFSGFHASLLGAAAVVASGPVLSLVDVTNNFTTLAWLPLVLWRAHSDREVSRPLFAGVLLALAFLAGEPFFAALGAVAYAIVVRRFRAIAIAGATSFGLAAVQLLPFAEMIPGSNRMGGFGRADVLRSSVSLWDWAALVRPPESLPENFVPLLYIGMIPALLALAGVAVTIRERRWIRLLAWGGTLVVAIVIASGPGLLADLPLTIFRYPSRVVPLAVFAVAAFAAAGWERLRRGSTAVDVMLIAAIVFELSVAARPLLISQPFSRPRIPYPDPIGRDRKILQSYSDLNLRGGTRLTWVAGYLNLLELRFAALTAAPLTSQRYSALVEKALNDVQTVREMGIGYVLSRRRLPAPFVPIGYAGRVLVHRVGGAFPMAYVRTDSGRIVPASAIALDAWRARVRVTAPEAGLLVLTQNDASGWTCILDGREVRGERALDTFRAVRVGPGEHFVEWRYAPRSLLLGGVITVATLIAILLLSMRGVLPFLQRMSSTRATFFFSSARKKLLGNRRHAEV